MATYVMSDIHGKYELFMKLLEKIQFSDEDELYVLGDVVDRGEQPIKALQEMMKHPNIIPIVGNHEMMAITCLRFLLKDISEENVQMLSDEVVNNLLTWQMNGSMTTTDEFHRLSLDERKEIIEYIENFSLMEEVFVGEQRYILVHAGFENFDPERDLDDYDVDELIWTRLDYDRVYFEDAYLVTGHTPTQTIEQNPNPGRIFRANNHIAIDCGACFGGNLAALCLETGEEFYVSSMER